MADDRNGGGRTAWTLLGAFFLSAVSGGLSSVLYGVVGIGSTLATHTQQISNLDKYLGETHQYVERIDRSGTSYVEPRLKTIEDRNIEQDRRISALEVLSSRLTVVEERQRQVIEQIKGNSDKLDRVIELFRNQFQQKGGL